MSVTNFKIAMEVQTYFQDEMNKIIDNFWEKYDFKKLSKENNWTNEECHYFFINACHGISSVIINRLPPEIMMEAIEQQIKMKADKEIGLDNSPKNLKSISESEHPEVQKIFKYLDRISSNKGKTVGYLLNKLMKKFNLDAKISSQYVLAYLTKNKKTGEGK